MAELQGELSRLKNICQKQWKQKDELVA
jgi:hypothetical protein